MMAPRYDFDTLIDRRASASVKWDKYRGTDVIPLWVADMDFAAPPEVLRALHERIDHGIFGYGHPPDDLVTAVGEQLERDYRWRIEPEWLVWLPGLVTGLNVACRAVGNPGAGVATYIPVYPPFMSAPHHSDRELITAPLREAGGDWRADAAALAAALTATTRLFLLCNPHNPVGRAFSRQELEETAAICLEHDLVICSDEIHAGLVLEPGIEHIPIATLSPEVAARTITLMAPSKTFNIPGLGCAFAVISSPNLRRSFKRAMERIVPHVNVLGFTAALAAYREGGPWRAELLAYLRGNRDLVVERLGRIPALTVNRPEATYLAWIDARQAGLEQPVQFFEEAGVGLSDGAEFGAPGFLRLNFGAPRSLLHTALERMERAMASHRK